MRNLVRILFTAGAAGQIVMNWHKMRKRKMGQKDQVKLITKSAGLIWNPDTTWGVLNYFLVLLNLHMAIFFFFFFFFFFEYPQTNYLKELPDKYTVHISRFEKEVRIWGGLLRIVTKNRRIIWDTPILICLNLNTSLSNSLYMCSFHGII